MSDSAMVQLHIYKERVDLAKIGLLSGVHPVMNDTELKVLRDNMAQYAVAHALMVKGIGTGIEASLVVRPLIPSEDLLDGGGGTNGTPPNTNILSTEWRQPVLGEYTDGTGSKDNGAEINSVQIYTTGKLSLNDQRVIVFYGVRYIGGGNFRTSPVMKSTMIIWKRGTVKTIDKWHLQALNASRDGYLCAMTPILYKLNDIASINFVPNKSVAGGNGNKFDVLEMMGLVVEAIGLVVMG